jgi:hypothetical protein
MTPMTEGTFPLVPFSVAIHISGKSPDGWVYSAVFSRRYPLYTSVNAWRQSPDGAVYSEVNTEQARIRAG